MTGIDWVPGGLYVSTFGEGVLYAPLSLTDLAAWRALAAVHAAVSSREVVTLTWPAPPATGVATTFAVASSSDGGSHWHPVAAGVTGTTLRLADLAGGRIYEFAVTAVSPFGESAPVTSLPLTVPRIPLVPLTIAFRARSTALPATAASRVAVFLARLAMSRPEAAQATSSHRAARSRREPARAWVARSRCVALKYGRPHDVTRGTSRHS